MSAFTEFGFTPSHNTSPGQFEVGRTIGHSEYIERAKPVLNSLADIVLTNFAQVTEESPVRWHPSGFMVFSLGVHRKLGLLRLHVWPKDLRRIKLRAGDTIHDHAWRVVSRVVFDTYEDTMYDTTVPTSVESDEDRKEQGLLRIFSAGYLSDGSSALSTDGSCVQAIPTTHRRIAAGSFHGIEPGAFHQPNIAHSSTVATLVLNSFRVLPYGPHVLIDGPAETINETRQPVTASEISYVREQLA